MTRKTIPLLLLSNIFNQVYAHEDTAQDVYVMTTWVVISVIFLVYLLIVASSWPYIRQRPPIPFVFILFFIFIPPVFVILFLYWWLFIGLFSVPTRNSTNTIEVQVVDSNLDNSTRRVRVPSSRRDLNR